MEKDVLEISEKIEQSFNASDKTFYFAKINIHGNIFKPNLDELIEEEIPRVIENAQEIKLKHSTISFTDINRLNIDGNITIIGHVTNSKKERLRYKDGTKTFVASTEHEVANSAMFIYDLKSEILAFTTASKISVNSFIDYFTNLLSNDDKVGKVIIKLIPENYDIIKEIKSVEKITYIKFSLIHPNPGKRHYNLYKQLVKDTSSREMEVSFKDDADGLTVKIEEDQIKTDAIKYGVDLVESGYGEIEMRGENYSYIESGKNRRTKKRVSKKKRFNSKTSNKKLSLKGIRTSAAIKKVTEYINNILSWRIK